MSESDSRLRVVFADLRRAVDDVILEHQVTPGELPAVLDWLQRAADAGGRYEFRTVMPGTQTLGLDPDGPLGALTEALRRPGLRPLHIHSIVTADGMLPLTTQLHFDGDPLVDAAIEGPVPAAAVKTTTVHEGYRVLTHDYVLRTR